MCWMIFGIDLDINSHIRWNTIRAIYSGYIICTLGFVSYANYHMNEACQCLFSVARI